MPKHARNLPLAQETPEESELKLSTLDKNIISATKALDNPTKSSIANHVVQLGGAKHIQTVYKRLKQKDYLRLELAEVRRHNLERIQREHVPKALIKLKKQLNNKNDSVQMRAINTTLKYGMGEMINAPESGVAIGTITNAQIIIEANSGRKDSSESVKNDPED